MNYRRILCPIDFSEPSAEALRVATALARESGARLLITYVEQVPVLLEGGYYGVHEAEVRQQEEALRATVPDDPQVEYEHLLLSGEPGPAILRAAEEAGADLIVMGTHGRTGLMRLLMGSVAEAVVRGAPCPVLTIRHAVGQSSPQSAAT